MNFSSFQNTTIQASTTVSFEADFYCKFSINKVAEKFSTALKKPVIVIEDEDNFTPDKNNFYIISKYGYGKERYQFYTGPIQYSEARVSLISIFSVIKEYGYTDNTCIVDATIEFNPVISGITLKKLNILKFILEFNEEMMYRFYPDQKDSLYVKSIKNVLPENKFFRSDNLKIEDFNYILPNMKFYGVIFDDVKDGKLTFRYIGGKDYEYNVMNALNVLGLYIDFASRCLFDPQYTDKNKEELKTILKGTEKLLLAYESSNKFQELYPDIKLTIDMDSNLQIMKSKFVKFRDDIFELLANSDITKGEINYDSALSKIQARNLKGHIYEIRDWEFVECDLTIGYAKNCNFFECKLENSSVNRCNLYRFSKAKKSKLKDTYINRTCEITDSLISGSVSTIDGKIVRGKIIGGRIGNHAVISGETEKMDYSKIYTK